MQSQPRRAPEPLPGHEAEAAAWRLALAAACWSERMARSADFVALTLADDGQVRPLPAGHEDALVAWRPGGGWEPLLPPQDPRHALVDLYLPICSATRARPITVGHLGQSLDGFIATRAGESQFITGRENIVHLHRMRALSDAVIVGAGTVAADDPLLTTRHVPGPNPLRVIFDPSRRLAQHYRVFSDDSATTLYVCARSLTRPGESHFGRAAVVAAEDTSAGVDVTSLIRMLQQRGCARIFVEGGGVTVSALLEANLLDRLQVAIAPLIIGDGRPAIRLPARTALRDCHIPRYRVFRMGDDVLFDCELRSNGHQSSGSERETYPAVARVI